MPHPPAAPSPSSTPELLYLLHGDPGDLAEALAGMRAADIAEALRELQPEAAAKVMAALPFDLAVQVFDEPELEYHRFDIIRRMDERAVGPLVDAMSADQQADLFRELADDERARYAERARALLRPHSREELRRRLEEQVLPLLLGKDRGGVRRRRGAAI
jgi:Mg/Co/Ni transporter MgtE